MDANWRDLIKVQSSGQAYCCKLSCHILLKNHRYNVFRSVSCWAMGSTLSSPEWRAFDFESESPYDLKHYVGRIAHFYTILDPRTLLISKEQLQSSKEILSRFQSNPSIVNDPATNRLLWRSKLDLGAVLHPDTKEPIFWAFRFSAFPVLNIPVSNSMNSLFQIDVNSTINTGDVPCCQM